MKITVVLPYENAAAGYHLWAHEENGIDFRKEKDRATRCTVSFAAEELESYLKKLGFEVEISDKKSRNFSIILTTTQNEEGEEFTYSMDDENGFTIDGNGRVGVLYGVYEFLEKQGVYWLNPWEEIIPENVSELTIPELRHYRASFYGNRGFNFDGTLKESEKLWLWMARYKLNTVPFRPHTVKLQRKLGFVFSYGGHVLSKILGPDYVLPDGRTQWEAHPEWFGMPEDGIQKKETAVSRNFCVSQDSALEYISQWVIDKLKREWYEADFLEVWSFDCWGGICHCEACKRLGNGTDHTLRMMSYLRSALDKAYDNGVLDRQVYLNGGAYEGTADLEPPLGPVPENIRNTRDFVAFAPINRCYAHTYDDESCEKNRFYAQCLKNREGVTLEMVEYYNVSKFQDLPFLFTKTMAHDFKFYHENGVRNMIYMHIPMLHWDVKNLTQILFAKLCWDVDTDCAKLQDTYFRHRYGIHADAMGIAYALMEEAGKYCANWRAWSVESVLSNLMKWNGCKPTKPLQQEPHLKDTAAEEGIKSVNLYKEAIAIMEKAHSEAELLYLHTLSRAAMGNVPVNPVELRMQRQDPATEHLQLDLIYANYGKDCMEMITLMVMYYDALRFDGDHTAIFAKIEPLAKKMMNYFIPAEFDGLHAEVDCYDALKRCQLKGTYYRCKAYRLCME